MPRFRPKTILSPNDAGVRERERWRKLGVIKPGPDTWVSHVRDPVTSEYYIDKQWYGLMKGSKFPENPEAEKKILAAIRKLFDDPDKWTKGSLCKLGGGKSWTKVESPEVRSWCIVGALDLIKIRSPVLAPYADRLYNRLNAKVRQIGFGCLEDFNDDSRVTHAHLIKFLEKMQESIV